MDTETKKFIDEVVQRSTGTVGELLSANWSIVDSTLAPIYGVDLGGRDRAHEPAQAPRHPEPGGVPVGVRARAGVGPGASRRGGHAPGRVHEAARSAVAEHPGRAARRRTRRSRRAIASTSTRPTPPAPPATTPSTRSASRSRCSTAWARSARAGTTAGTFKDEHLGANGPLTSVNTTSNTTIASSARLPQRLRGDLRRQQRAGDGARQQRAGARVPGPAVLPVVLGPQRRLRCRTPSSRSSNMWKQMPSDQQGKFVEVLVAYVRSPLFDQRSAP